MRRKTSWPYAGTLFAGVVSLLGMSASQALSAPAPWGRPGFSGYGGGFYAKRPAFGVAGRAYGGGTRFNLSWQTGPYGAALARGGAGWGRGYGYGYGRGFYPNRYRYPYGYGFGSYIDRTGGPSNAVTIINEAPPQQTVPVGIPSIADLPADTGIRSTTPAQPVLYVIDPVTRGARVTKGSSAKIVDARTQPARQARRIDVEPDQEVASSGPRIIRIEAARGR